MEKILIIIPALNEADNILQTVEDIRAHCTLKGADLLVVDDSSVDDTARLLREEGIPHLTLVHNLGIGGSVQAGYRYAMEKEYDIAVQFDGDGQHDAAYIEALVRPILDGSADYTVGSRFVTGEGEAPGEGFRSSSARRAGIRFLSFLVRLLADVRVKDVTSGFRAVNANLIRVFAHHYAQDYAEPEALVWAGRNGARITEIPVQMKERAGGKSSITPLRSVYYMIKVTLSLMLTGRAGKKQKPGHA